MRRRHGLTIEQYDQMLENQNGVCAICGEPETHKLKGVVVRLAIDHCHKSSRIRGLLCHKCNSILGYANDSVEILASSIKYLDQEKNK